MFGKRFKKQRAWDCYTHLAVHIANELRAFKKYNVHSYPHGFNNIEEWHEVVDKMIYSFEQIEKDSSDRVKIEEGLQLFAKYFEDLWD